MKITDPGIYQSEARVTDPAIYNAPTFPKVGVGSGSVDTAVTDAPTMVPQGTVVEGTAGIAQAEAIVAENRREKASLAQSVKAAASEWGTTNVYRFLTGPAHEYDPDFQSGEFVASVPMPLNEEEREFLLGAVSQSDAEHRLETVQRMRRNAQAMGDNPVTGFVTAMLDPVYLGVDASLLWTGRLARAASLGRVGERLTVGASAAAGATGVLALEQEVRPVSSVEFVLNGVLNGAAASMLYRPGRGLVKADPNYPDEVLNNLMAAQRKGQAPLVNPDRVLAPLEFSTPAARPGRELGEALVPAFDRTAYGTVLDAVLRSPELDDVRVLRVSRAELPDAFGTFSPKDKTLRLREDADPQVALHELVHATVDQKLLKNPEFKAELASMHREVLNLLGKQSDADAKFWSEALKNPREFVTYALTSPRFREWAKKQEVGASGRTRANAVDTDFVVPEAAPVKPGTPSLWDRVLDVLAKILGLKGPTKRALERYAADADRYARAAKDPRAGVWRSMDDRLNEMLHAHMRTLPDQKVYVEGLVTNVHSTTPEAEVRRKVAQAETNYDIGRRISWSLHKTLSNFGSQGKRVADLLVDNPLNPMGDSVDSQYRAIRADLTAHQVRFEELIKDELAKRGAGLWNRLRNTRKSLQVLDTLQKEVRGELLRRQRNQHFGTDTPSKYSPAVQAIADAVDKMNAAALKEAKAAGVRGAEDVAEQSGYFSRRWDYARIEDARKRLADNGYSMEEADRMLREMLQKGLAKANGMSAEVAGDVAKVILDRAERKGFFEDSSFRAHAGNEALAELRDILKGSGLSAERQQRVLDVLAGKVDEGGKAPFMKRRLDIDTDSGVFLADGTKLTVGDLIDSDLLRITDSYLDQMAGRAALARMGLRDPSDIAKLRSEFLRGIPKEADRKDAASMFDNTINGFLGQPVGDDLNQAMRNVQALTRMVGLASSGVWQATEVVTAMQRYGVRNTLKAMVKNPVFKDVMFTKTESTNLADVLARNSAQDIRLRPFITRLEDNFDIPNDAVVQQMLQQGQQLVPYLNAQKYIQTVQARLVGNLVADVFRRAGEGNADAVRVLQQYGLEPHTVARITPELRAAGMDTAKWSDETWQAVRGPLTKMMDEAVLRNRRGDIPAFAQFSQVGKFIFTFRSFVLGAHNKVLAGTASRDGLGGVTLLMLYQFPLVALATQANSTVQGKPITDIDELVSKTFSQMSVIGWGSEILGVVTGDKQQFGAPGLIFIDRMYKLAGSAATAPFSDRVDAGDVADAAINAMPLMSLIPGARAIGETFKE